MHHTGTTTLRQSSAGFFGRVLRWTVELGCAVVVAVHASYFTSQTPRRRLLEVIGTPSERITPPLVAAAVATL